MRTEGFFGRAANTELAADVGDDCQRHARECDAIAKTLNQLDLQDQEDPGHRTRAGLVRKRPFFDRGRVQFSQFLVRDLLAQSRVWSLHTAVLFDHCQPLGLPGELVFVVSSEKRGSAVASYDYCIESKHPIAHRFLPGAALPRAYQDCSQAVAIAAKCVPNPFGDDVRVVHVPSGEIVFRVVSPEGLPSSASASSH